MSAAAVIQIIWGVENGKIGEIQTKSFSIMFDADECLWLPGIVRIITQEATGLLNASEEIPTEILSTSAWRRDETLRHRRFKIIV